MNNTANTVNTADTALEAAKVAAFAAHKEYLEAHWSLFNAVLAVASGDRPAGTLYELLATLDAAVTKHATACWMHGAETGKDIYGKAAYG